MSTSHALICWATLFVMLIPSWFAIKAKNDMEAALDWGKIGPGPIARTFRDVVRQYKLAEPHGEPLQRYRKYYILSCCFLLLLVIEVIFFNR
jgi:hypothetical protein